MAVLPILALERRDEAKRCLPGFDHRHDVIRARHRNGALADPKQQRNNGIGYKSKTLLDPPLPVVACLTIFTHHYWLSGLRCQNLPASCIMLVQVPQDRRGRNDVAAWLARGSRGGCHRYLRIRLGPLHPTGLADGWARIVGYGRLHRVSAGGGHGCLSLPRPVRTAAALTVLVGACLLLYAWPSWEGRVFPNVVSVDELVSAISAYRSPESAFCVYTADGPLWVAGRETPPDTVRIGDRVIGFYANPLPLGGRIALMSLGFRLRPVWPGATRSVP